MIPREIIKEKSVSQVFFGKVTYQLFKNFGISVLALASASADGLWYRKLARCIILAKAKHPISHHQEFRS